MSNSYDTHVSSEPGSAQVDSPGTLETAKEEATELTATAAAQAMSVGSTAKTEASSVLGEAKVQAKDLYAQTQRELKDQAQTQQQRVALGLRAVSGELDAMASNSSSSGLASDVVQQVSDRLSAASTWLGDRDPGSVLQEVKGFARRQPAVFIFAAVAIGVAAGRLTRALAQNASDDNVADAAAQTGDAPRASQPEMWSPSSNAGVPVADPDVDTAVDTPIYAQSSSEWADALSTEDGDVRRDSV
ncbi:hypothetical protein LG299_00305 [Microbacterium lacus]|uniref:hypothetical protein n=1 Tax=Microbacterium lacus TaxID=415217 RepID=UPI003850058D